MAISQPRGWKWIKQDHFLFCNFKSLRKQSGLVLFIFGPWAEIWPFSHFFHSSIIVPFFWDTLYPLSAQPPKCVTLKLIKNSIYLLRRACQTQYCNQTGSSTEDQECRLFKSETSFLIYFTKSRSWIMHIMLILMKDVIRTFIIVTRGMENTSIIMLIEIEAKFLPRSKNR